MTDFDRVRSYYRDFDEQNRLARDNSGRLEYEMTMSILRQYLPRSGAILDLGGGAGVYSFPLADAGYEVFLADLSEKLIAQAKRYGETRSSRPVSCDVVNAMDLSLYEDEKFDAVVLLGPLYHLLEEAERRQCVSEVRRVLKPGGTVFAGFIPRLSGSAAKIDKYLNHPEQLNAETLERVFRSGKYNNLADAGFQEGYYPFADEIEELFAASGFLKKQLRSVRGFCHGKEDALYRLEQEAPEMFGTVIRLLHETAAHKAVVEMCGHAIYVGCRR